MHEGVKWQGANLDVWKELEEKNKDATKDNGSSSTRIVKLHIQKDPK